MICVKLLIVEDSRLYRQAIVRELKVHFPKAEFILAGNGKEGLCQYQLEQPDAVVFDLLMPVMDGIEMFRELVSSHSKVRGVALTADIQHMVQEELLDLGVLSFVNKPLTPEKARHVAETIKSSLAVDVS